MSGFINLPAKVSTSDGRNFVLLAPLEYVAKSGIHYRGIAGAKTDGASTPPLIWVKYAPFGPWWLGAVLHDCAYRTTLEKLTASGLWMRVALPKEEIDLLFLEMMESNGVGLVDRETIYNAVKEFGINAYSDDLAMPIV